MTLVILYPFSIWFVCKLDSWAIYYEYLVWVLKPGMTEWYQTHVDRRNASLVRRVIFSRFFFKPKLFLFYPSSEPLFYFLPWLLLSYFGTSILVMQTILLFFLIFQIFF
jgi:hypothetical protein